MRTVHASKLSTISMVAGGEKAITKVVDGGEVKEWVGFGWITLGPATAEDIENYPAVQR